MNDDKRVASTADRLREAMNDAGMSQADLMRATDLHRSAISRYLLGEYEPKAHAVGKMAKALNVSEMWLFGYDVPKQRTAAQKKNDQLAELIVKMRSDADFYNDVMMLGNLQPADYAAVHQLLVALNNK